VFDHVAVRVTDLPSAERALQQALAPLAIEQTTSSPRFAGWGDFLLPAATDERPPTERIHVGFVAPSPEAVDAFWQAGVDAGLRDDGPPGPRPAVGPDYYGAFLRDAADNSFEAVHRDGLRRGGNVDHVALRVADLDASVEFYSLVGAQAGFVLANRGEERALFAHPASGGLLMLVAGPPSANVHLAFGGSDDDGAVQRFHAIATDAGHRSNGEPGERPNLHPGYYAAFVFDPDGNNIEIANHHRG
jgi:catechol 2,3-dioxygenase-like lactoylglutathione lyase family enzyme